MSINGFFKQQWCRLFHRKHHNHANKWIGNDIDDMLIYSAMECSKCKREWKLSDYKCPHTGVVYKL